MSELCRICMHKKQEMFPLIKINSKSLERRGEKFEDCFNLKIMAVPYLHICKQCDLQLIELYYFKQLALRTHNYLLDKTNLEGNDFKQEPPDHENATSFKEEDTTNEFYNIEYLEEEATNVDENMDEIVGEDNEALIGNSDDYVDDEYCTEYASFLVSFVEDSQTEGTLESAENDDKQANDETPGQLHPENTIKRKQARKRKKPAQTYSFRCAICKRPFMREDVFLAHQRSHQGLPGYSCNICGKSFKERAKFEYHMKNHRGERDWKCKFCGKAFLIEWDLELHTRTHTDYRPYICEVCGKGFRVYCHLTEHRETHNETNVFQCNLCNAKLHTKTTLRGHMASAHRQGNVRHCPICNQTFVRRYRLHDHIKKYHSDELTKQNYQREVIEEDIIVDSENKEINP